MDRQNRPRRQSFLHGAMLLTAGVLGVKVLGALFKIPLSTVISEDGMGCFSTAYSFYNVIFSLATAGFPVAVARAVSLREAKGNLLGTEAVRSAAKRLFAVTGVLGTLLMALTAPIYVRAVGSPGALPAMLTLSPCILFCSMMSAHRGYFEGLSDMVPTAVSQLIEAAGKLVFGLTGAYLAVRHFSAELETAGTVLGAVPQTESAGRLTVSALGAAGAVAGVTLGAALGWAYLAARGRRSRRYEGKVTGRLQRREIMKRLLKDAVPIAVGSVAMSVSGLIDASFLQTRVAAALLRDPAPIFAMYAGQIPPEHLEAPQNLPNYLFGCYNMALAVFMLVPSVTQAFGTSALPSVTGAWARRDGRRLEKAVGTVLRVTNLFALPAGIGLSVLAGPIARLLYGDRPSAGIVEKCLVVMGAASIFAAVTTPLGSLLQAAGKTDLPVLLVLSGLLLKVALNYALAGIPQINILGGGISTLLAYGAVTAAELFAVRRTLGVPLGLRENFAKPLFAAVGCGAAAKGSYLFFSGYAPLGPAAAVCAVLCAAFVYAVLLFLFGAVRKEDLLQMPGGEKIAEIFQKHLKFTQRWGRI